MLLGTNCEHGRGLCHPQAVGRGLEGDAQLALRATLTRSGGTHDRGPSEKRGVEEPRKAVKYVRLLDPPSSPCGELIDEPFPAFVQCSRAMPWASNQSLLRIINNMVYWVTMHEA